MGNRKNKDSTRCGAGSATTTLTNIYLKRMRGRLKEFSLFLRRWLPVAVWAGVVLYASTSVGSGNRTVGIMRTILSWFNPDLGLATLTEINYGTRKTAHVVQFLVYALLVWRGLSLVPAVETSPRRLAVWTIGSAVVLAFASEGIQLFSPLRNALFTDVILDVSGAVAGTLIAWTIAGFFCKAPSSAATSAPPDAILVTSDLHLADSGRATLAAVRSALVRSGALTLVVAGDFGVANRASEWMAALREAAGEYTNLIICLGNQDHWLEHPDGSCQSPEDVRERFWRPACTTHGIQCLDFENVRLPGLVISGGYGHYDFGFRDPGASVDDAFPDTADYENGSFRGLVHPDAGRIPGLRGEAGRQLDSLSRRLSLTNGDPVLFVTHTAPFDRLLPGRSGQPGASFFRAFSGNASVGRLLVTHAPSIALAVSGHTFHASPLIHVSGIPCISTGSSPGFSRFLLFHPSDKSVKMFF